MEPSWTRIEENVMFGRVHQMAAPEAKFAVYDCLVSRLDFDARRAVDRDR